MNRYDSYKDSGVQWIGEIPSHWDVVPLKNLGVMTKGVTFTKADIVDDGNPAISYGQIHSKDNTGTCLNRRLIRNIPDDFIKNAQSSIVGCGDFIFADTSEDLEGAGNAIYIDNDIQLYGGYHTIVFKTYTKDNRYLAYLFLTDCWRSQIRSRVSGVKVYSITQSILSSTKVILPLHEEQTAIATYLDNKCSKIDNVIATQEKRVELLRELKQSIITRAVTRGINPDAKMKDSGVEWIGEIPEHWEVKKLKYLFENLDNLRQPITADQRSKENPIYDYYGASGVIDKIDFYNVDDKVLLIGEDGANLVFRNLPLIYKASGKFWVNNHAHILKPHAGVDYEYMFYTMECADYSTFITGSAQPKLSQEKINQVQYPLPPVEEQQAIVTYIEQKTSKLDSSITKALRQIELLKEYKQSLITEVVTGKRKVV